ncbi:retropepsin-like aspartic protease family protein [Consotaella salsifontis]|uniref:Aspartyl protease family protein n=1 Tax=Consotaella salsifontis TaxID=1365950 RepID=A0A1T4LA69_9HYPH|nr:TIGR02281 family clan AA aspartic protease [Consotaella salsifontis]SJZ51639.1 aspartyl protease family protein [Consotaella salsifontis]
MRNTILLTALIALLVVGGLFLVMDGDGYIGPVRDGQFAELVYLAAIGLFLGSGIVAASRGGLSSTIKAAGAWVALFAILIGAYAFSAELRDVGARMLGALIPGRVVTLSSGEGKRVMVMRDAGGQFQVDAVVNGVATTLLVDTGASTVAFDRAAARRIGIDVDRLSFDSRVETANGVARAAPIRLDSLRIGPIERRNVPAAVTEGEGSLTLLGMSFLSTLGSVEIRGDRLILTD